MQYMKMLNNTQHTMNLNFFLHIVLYDGGLWSKTFKSVDNIKYVDKKIAFIRYFHCKFHILVRRKLQPFYSIKVCVGRIASEKKNFIVSFGYHIIRLPVIPIPYSFFS